MPVSVHIRVSVQQKPVSGQPDVNSGQRFHASLVLDDSERRSLHCDDPPSHRTNRAAFRLAWRSSMCNCW